MMKILLRMVGFGLPGTGKTASSSLSYFSITRLEIEIVRNRWENITEPSHLTIKLSRFWVPKLSLDLTSLILGRMSTAKPSA